ncbi:MAG: heme exporter protein CcmD [Pseudomonadota bacterium]
MSTLDTFFNMGGHGAFIWPCYAFAALLMGGLAINSWQSLARRKRQLAHLEGQRAAIKKATVTGAQKKEKP